MFGVYRKLYRSRKRRPLYPLAVSITNVAITANTTIRFIVTPISRNSRIFLPVIAGNSQPPTSEPPVIAYKITMII